MQNEIFENFRLEKGYNIGFFYSDSPPTHSPIKKIQTPIAEQLFTNKYYTIHQ